MYAPLSLNVTVILTFDLETPTSHDQPPYQVTRSMSYLVFDRTRFVYGPTDGLTNQHVQKKNLPPFLRRGHNKNNYSETITKRANMALSAHQMILCPIMLE